MYVCSRNNDYNGECMSTSTLAVIGGGCPDPEKCRETCIPCYRRIGHITAFCRPAGGGIPFDECVCDFTGGARCDPTSGPHCPKPPSTSNYFNLTKV